MNQVQFRSRVSLAMITMSLHQQRADRVCAITDPMHQDKYTFAVSPRRGVTVEAMFALELRNTHVIATIAPTHATFRQLHGCQRKTDPAKLTGSAP